MTPEAKTKGKYLVLQDFKQQWQELATWINSKRHQQRQGLQATMQYHAEIS